MNHIKIMNAESSTTELINNIRKRPPKKEKKELKKQADHENGQSSQPILVDLKNLSSSIRFQSIAVAHIKERCRQMTDQATYFSFDTWLPSILYLILQNFFLIKWRRTSNIFP